MTPPSSTAQRQPRGDPKGRSKGNLTLARILVRDWPHTSCLCCCHYYDPDCNLKTCKDQDERSQGGN